jgi:tetratricopeptide (TPR) repeat protein
MAMETIISLDPLYGGMLTDLGYSLLHNGNNEQARVLLNRAVSLGANNTWNIRTLASSLVYRGELEQAWQTLAPTAFKEVETDGSTLDLLLFIARTQANTDRMDQVLNHYLTTDTQNSLGRVFSRALVYLQQGRQDELSRLITDMQESQQAAMRERPDSSTTLLGFVQLYSLQKDQVKLAEAVEAYYAAVKPDALRIVENRTIPTAYAIAGDSEAFLAYLDEVIEQYGPWEHYYFTIDPAFNGMRDLPRFKAYDKQYRQWLEQQ